VEIVYCCKLIADTGYCRNVTSIIDYSSRITVVTVYRCKVTAETDYCYTVVDTNYCSCVTTGNAY